MNGFVSFREWIGTDFKPRKKTPDDSCDALSQRCLTAASIGRPTPMDQHGSCSTEGPAVAQQHSVSDHCSWCFCVETGSV